MIMVLFRKCMVFAVIILFISNFSNLSIGHKNDSNLLNEKLSPTVLQIKPDNGILEPSVVDLKDDIFLNIDSFRNKNNQGFVDSNVEELRDVNIYGGFILIEGYPDDLTIECYPNSVFNIDVGEYGNVITINVDYYMDCPGGADDGYCDIEFVGGGDSDSAHTGIHEEGTLSISKFFDPDETFTVQLHAKETDWWGAYTHEAWDYSSFSTKPIDPPDDPSNLTAYNPTTNSIQLSWTKGIDADKTVIRRADVGYPNSPNDGDEIYNGTGNTTTDMNLNANTTYYYRAWSYKNNGYVFSDGGSEDYGTTLPIVLPTVQTLDAAGMDDFSAELYGIINDDGGGNCDVQFMYKDDGDIWKFTGWNGSNTDDVFYKRVFNLTPATHYIFKAGAKNSAGEEWGDIKEFNTTNTGAPSIRDVEAYYADGSEASDFDGFLLMGLDLPIHYSAFILGDNADAVEFVFGEQNITDNNGDDGWTATFNTKDINNTSEILRVRAYNNTFHWGNYVTYNPKIIVMQNWMEKFYHYILDNSDSELISYSIYTQDPILPSDNYWILDMGVDFSSGSPNNPDESPVKANVPDPGVPVNDIGGDYGCSGGIGCSLQISSDGEIDVSGHFDAEAYAKSFGGKIGTILYGNLGLENDTIIWNEMYITINGEVTIPVFIIPLSICGIGVQAGIDITPHVKLTFELDHTSHHSEGIVPGLGIKISGIDGNVGCRVRAYAEAGFIIGGFYTEAGGDGTLFFQAPPNPSYFSDFHLSCWIGGKLRILMWTVEGWYQYNWKWSNYNTLPIMDNKTYNETEWSPLNRSYLHPDQNGYGNEIPWIPSQTRGTIIENSFPYAHPSIKSNPNSVRSDEVMMVWAHDKWNGPAVNGMELKWTTWDENNGLGNIQYIPDTRDDKLQMDPKIAYDINGNVVCVFIQTNSSITENSSVTDVFNATEIAYCVYDEATGWGEINTITNNMRMDVSPVLASNEKGDIVLVWSSDHDYNHTTIDDRTIYGTFWDGVNWSDVMTVVENQSMVYGPSIAINNSDVICVVSIDEDKDLTTAEDQEIFHITFSQGSVGNMTKFTHDDFQDKSPSVVYGRDGYPYIIWLKQKHHRENGQEIYDGNLYYRRVSSSKDKDIRLINGSVFDPIGFQSQSSTKDDVDFAVTWKSGHSSNELRMAKINTGLKNDDCGGDLVYSSDKKLSEVDCCFTPSSIAVATTERQNLTNGGKHCNLSFIYVDTLDNHPPNLPSNPLPVDNESGVDCQAGLSWGCIDPDGDTLTFDVYLEANDPYPDILVSSGQNSTVFDPGLLSSDTTYYWRIVAHDNHSYTADSPIWSFITEEEMPTVTHMGIMPSSDAVNIGEEFTATIYINPIESIGGWQIYEFHFTQGITNVTKVTPGSDWSVYFDPGETHNDTGMITNIQSWTAGPYPDTNHTACIINFTALQPGECTFELVNVQLTNSEFNIINVTTLNATLTITTPSIIYNENPINESTGVERPPIEINATVEDPNGDIMDVYIKWKNHSNEWGALENYVDVGNGTYCFIPPSDNDWIWGNTTYTWSVNVTDGNSWTNETYYYITGGSRYDVNNNDMVNFQDAGLVWIHRTSEVDYDGIYDVNQNGVVNFQDAGLTWVNRN